jgi:hypothetical protein
MELLDTLKKQSASWLTNFGPQIIESGLKSTGLIKVAAPPTSNLTAAQVMSGQTGAINNLPSPSSNPMPAWLIPVAVVLGILGIVFVAKKKR